MMEKLKCTLLLSALMIFASLQAFAAAGAVYTLTNSTSGNAVLVFNRMPNGQLTAGATISAGGNGTGSGLGNQGALAMDAANRFLFAVNAGSSTIASFAIGDNGLTLRDVVPSGGLQPISLTVSGNVLYVLNNGAAVGGSDTIAGFSVTANGHLKPIVSNLPLSAASVGPAQISFNTNGNLLVVTEKATNNIDIFTVDGHGVAVGPVVNPSAGQTPFGFAFGKRNQLLVSDAFGGGANAGAMSSYIVSDAGAVRAISATVPDNQTAPCWVAVTNDGRFMYTTNTATANVSGYSVGFGGSLRLLNASGVTASTGTGSKPLDATISNDSRYLYVLTPGTSNVQGFAIGWDGSLTALTPVGGIPASASGLIAR